MYPAFYINAEDHTVTEIELAFEVSNPNSLRELLEQLLGPYNLYVVGSDWLAVPLGVWSEKSGSSTFSLTFPGPTPTFLGLFPSGLVFYLTAEATGRSIVTQPTLTRAQLLTLLRWHPGRSEQRHNLLEQLL